MAPRKKPKIVYIDEGTATASEVEERAVINEVVTPPPVVAPSQRAPKPALRRPSLILSLIFAGIVATVCAAFIFIPVQKPVEQPSKIEPMAAKPEPPNCLGVHPDIDWGHPLHELECHSGALEEGQGIGDLLMARNVDYRQVLNVMEIAKRKQMPEMHPGSPYHILYSPKNLQRPVLFVYEAEPASFVFMNLDGPPAVHLHGREVLRQQNRQLNVVIQTTLADIMYNRPSGLLLTRKLEAAIKWRVDLFHLAPGDRFLMLYEETQYEGNLTEVGDLLAVSYRQNGMQGYAFSYRGGDKSGYYDYDGKPMKSGFLMAPLEYGRISSPYDVNRVDPIARTGEIRAHLGTDYAAPEGTPILAVGDGEVMNAEFKGGNGNYVKLFHTDSIQTQYLHMSAFAEGIMPGAPVRQGQVIGYVGSTGRSTGPHVCFRYWKNGVQVDHRKEQNFGGSIGLQGDDLQRFFQRRDSLLGMMTEL
jgi:murein DD-endopeptidase MepM/ murein hydrolase activator NlpD